jgi:outer membrane protein
LIEILLSALGYRNLYGILPTFAGCFMKRVNRIFYFLSFICCLAAGEAGAQDYWTLERCVEYARDHNIQIKQSALQVRLARLTLQQSQYSRLPTLSASPEYGYNFGRSIDPTTNQFVNTQLAFSSIGVNFGLNLFTWFQQINTIAANKYAAAASNSAMEKLKNDVSLNVATAFLLILSNKEQVQTDEQQFNLSSAQLSNTHKQVQSGYLPESNEADLEAQQAKDSATLIGARNALIMSVLQMKALLNLDFEVSFEVEAPQNIDSIPLLNLAIENPQSIYDAALSDQPQMMADSFTVQAASKQVKAAKGAYYPTLALFGGLGTSYSSDYLQPTQALITYPSTQIGTVTINNNTYTVNSVSQQSMTSIYSKAPLGTQIGGNFRQNFGIALNIPILNGWQTRTNVQRAKVNLLNDQLTFEQDRLTLKQNIFQAYEDARGALENYNAAKVTLQDSQTAYDFANKRYNMGLINSVDFLTTQNNLFAAKTNLLTTKYTYIFKVKLLEFYKNLRLTL